MLQEREKVLFTLKQDQDSESDNKRLSKLQILRVILLHNTMAPYVHALFESLSENVDLSVYFCSKKPIGRNWDVLPRKYNYQYKILPGISFKIGLDTSNFNFSILNEILSKKPNAVIFGDYISLSSWITLLSCSLLRIPHIYWTEGVMEPKSILGTITRPMRILFA